MRLNEKIKVLFCHNCLHRNRIRGTNVYHSVSLSFLFFLFSLFCKATSIILFGDGSALHACDRLCVVCMFIWYILVAVFVFGRELGIISALQIDVPYIFWGLPYHFLSFCLCLSSTVLSLSRTIFHIPSYVCVRARIYINIACICMNKYNKIQHRHQQTFRRRFVMEAGKQPPLNCTPSRFLHNVCMI